ncbi:Hypothetical predicted protein [Olea europaea subsp. europaea]|uniref:DC1 domain-containing protein n=1 Tax=Olea europaea subsp. europaea TaxID=158383 RepID=A0A8S0SWI4_OLEEU|nr:Hypothetical predicted protein [Olea europaea subsp. europaea]
MHPLLKSSASMGNNKNSIIESDFPTSPQPVIVEEITHYTHPKHPLTKVNLPELFTCTGCKDDGSGKRFACQQCDFQLHEFCALSPPILQNHPLHGQHQLVFHAKPKQAGISWLKCDVCNKTIKGFSFRCRACSFQMHPCCAMLSTERNFPVHPHTLKLLPPLNTSSSSTDNRILCGECKKTRLGRVYLCTVCDYHLHAVCAKNLINGLALEYPSPGKADHDWKKGHATQVVFEAVGGLFEGLGQTIAEYFLQNIARGRGSTRSSEG